MGDYPNYLVELRKRAVRIHDSAVLLVASAAEKGYAAGGAHAMFEYMRNEPRKLSNQEKFSSLALAGTYALEGNKRDALKYLKIAYDQHEDDVVGIAGNGLFDNLHDDPEMQRILAGVKIQCAPGQSPQMPARIPIARKQIRTTRREPHLIAERFESQGGNGTSALSDLYCALYHETLLESRTREQMEAQVDAPRLPAAGTRNEAHTGGIAVRSLHLRRSPSLGVVSRVLA